MNIPKEVRLRTVVILLSSLLVLSSVSIYYAFSASTPTSGLTDIYIEPPMMESSYIIGIYTAPNICYLKNGTSGEITTTGTFYTIFQAAITALTTGGKIFIRAGRYTQNLGVTIQNSGIYIEGEALGGVGEPAVQIDYGGGFNNMITYYSVSTNYYLGGIKNIMFRGNDTTRVANSKAVYVWGFWSDLLFDHCGFMYFDIGVQLTSALTGSSKIWNIWFDNCLFEDNLRYGIYLSDTASVSRMIDRVRVTNSHFYDNLNSVYSDSDYVFHVTFTDNTVQAERGACINVTTGGRQWIITDNHIFDCGIGANGTMAGIMVNGSGTIYPDSWLIENNIIANHFTSAPVALNNSVWLTGTVRNFAVQNNYFYVASEGVRLSGLSLTLDPQLIIKGNVGNPSVTTTSWNMGFGAEPSSASYVIFKDSSYTYMMNGTTAKIDYESTNVSNVINFAIGNLTFGTVSVRDGTYSINNSIIGKSNITLALMTGVILTRTAGSSGYIVDVDSVSDFHLIGQPHAMIDCNSLYGFDFDQVTFCSIENLEIKNSLSGAIYLKRSNDSVLRNLYIHAWDKAAAASHCIEIDGSSRNVLDNLIVDGIDANAAARVCVWVGNNYYATMESGDNKILGGWYKNSPTDNGIYISGVYNQTIIGTTIYGCHANDHGGLKLRPSMYAQVSDLHIMDCWGGIEVSTAGARFNNSQYNYVQASITGAVGYGINVVTDRAGENVSNNVFDLIINNVTAGSAVNFGTSYGLCFLRYNTFRINANTIYKAGILVSCNVATSNVSDNTFYVQCQNTGTAGFGGGIVVSDANCIRNHFFASSLTDIGGDYVLDSGTSTLWDDNCIFNLKPIRLVSYSVNTTATTCVITHGLFSTPQTVIVSGNDTALHYTTTAISSTQITITISGTPGGNWTVYYFARYEP